MMSDISSGQIDTPQLLAALTAGHAPVILDVRREKIFADAVDVLPAARRADHMAPALGLGGDKSRPVIVYCIHGHNVSQLATGLLRAEGYTAAQLIGGIDGWRDAGAPVVSATTDVSRFTTGTIWVTRRRPKIDRIACPWFIRRFVDDRAKFLYVDPEFVLPVAEELGGVAYDIDGAPITHDGDRCSFDTLLDRFNVTDPVLRDLALFVRGADTAAHNLSPAAAGLLAVSVGMSALHRDDLAMLDAMMPVYDALHASLRYAKGEPHFWPMPKA